MDYMYQRKKNEGQKRTDDRWRDRPSQVDLCQYLEQVYYSKSDTRPQAVNWQKTAKIKGFRSFSDLVMDSNKSAKT